MEGRQLWLPSLTYSAHLSCWDFKVLKGGKKAKAPLPTFPFFLLSETLVLIRKLSILHSSQVFLFWIQIYWQPKESSILVTMSGAQTMVIGPIPCGFTARNSSCDLGLCGGLTCRLPAVSSSSAGLCNFFLGGWGGRRRRVVRLKKKQGRSRFIVDEIAGQYEESFEDIHGQLINSFTYKSVKTVLHQLYEMNPPKYMWFYNFVANNEVKDGTRFLRSLAKEHQELAERVMVTRLHLYGLWVKKCDHAKMYQRISDENLKLMRERLMETVIWPSEDTNSENTDL